MKKKIIALIILFCFCTVILGEDNAKPKIIEYEGLNAGINTYLFEGFQFKGYVPSKVNLTDIIKNEHTFLKKKGAKKFSIVGHSQGGLRVLGFAKEIEKSDPEMFNNLEAVITVSGVDRGLKALEGGLSAANAKLRRYFYILSGGALAVANVAPVLDIVTHPVTVVTGFTIFVLSYLFDLEVGEKIFTAISNSVISKSGLMGWVKLCLEANTKQKEKAILKNMGEIADMIPQSDFIKANVLESVPYTYKVKTGDKKYLGWERVTNRWGLKYWALRWKTAPVYTQYTGYNHISKIPKEIPVGYIVGLDNRTMDMLPADIRKKIRTGFKKAENVFHGVMIAHIVKSSLIWGLFTGSPMYAVMSRDARDFCRDLDGNIHKFLGSNEHDGLVAKESQFIPKELHEKYLGDDERGYETFNYNHKEIRYYKDTGKPPKEVHNMIKKMIMQGSKIRHK